MAFIKLQSGESIIIEVEKAQKALAMYRDGSWAHIEDLLGKKFNYSPTSGSSWHLLRKFLAIKSAWCDTGGYGDCSQALFSPPDKDVDAEWHKLILTSTLLYQHCCELCLNKYIHHTECTDPKTLRRTTTNSRNAIMYIFPIDDHPTNPFSIALPNNPGRKRKAKEEEPKPKKDKKDNKKMQRTLLEHGWQFPEFPPDNASSTARSSASTGPLPLGDTMSDRRQYYGWHKEHSLANCA